MNIILLAAWLAWLGVMLAFIGADLARSPDESYIRSIAGVEHRKSTWRRAVDRLGPAVAAWFPISNIEGLNRKLVWAGSPLGLHAEGLIGIKVLTVAGGLAAGGLLTSLGMPSVLVPLMAVAAYLFPDYWLAGVLEKRRRAIDRALPDTVGLLATALRAGVELGPAMERVGAKLPGPLGDEMRQAWREMSTGRPRAAALRAMAARTGVQSLERLIQTIITAEERGGMHLSDVLASFIEHVRESRRRRAQEQARKLPAKMLLPLILCIFLPMVMMLLTPIGMTMQGAF